MNTIDPLLRPKTLRKQLREDLKRMGVSQKRYLDAFKNVWGINWRIQYRNFFKRGITHN